MKNETRRRFFSIVFLSLICLAGAFAQAADNYVWLEGESPTKSNVKWTAAGSSHTDWLSGGKWLTFSMDEGKIEKELPNEGAMFEYAIPTPADGRQELRARIGF